MSTAGWRIVTPEAVVLDLEAAGIASRVFAAVIDLAVLGIVLSAISTAATAVAGAAGALGGSVIGTVLYLVGTFAVIVAWPVAWEVSTHGQSLGKMALGLRVITLEGAPIRFRHALIRGLVGVVEIFLLFGVPALTVALASPRFRRLGDHLAGTVVVRERSALPPSRAMLFTPPPGWEAFATSLDATRLTADHHRIVRSYLLRARDLAPGPRLALGRRVVDVVSERMHLPPDQRHQLTAHDPVVVLTAVAASYQKRFWR